MSETNTIRKIVGEDRVAEVILDRPDRGNALNGRMFTEIAEAFEELGADPKVRAIVIRGEGKGFCSGLDLMAAATDFSAIMTPGLAEERMELRRIIRDLQRKIEAPNLCMKPVIAAIHGFCIGGGLDLATACDIRLCSADARMSLRETRMAMVADLGSLQRLPRIVGDAATRELALTGKDIDAHRAERMGLVSRVLDSPEKLLDAAREEARAVAELPPVVVSGVKRILNLQDGLTVQQGLEQVATWNSAFLHSEDLQEAVTSFIQKRKPSYR